MTTPNIHTAIAAVYGAVGYVQKQRTQGLNYTYAGEAGLIAAVRPAMVEAGIYMSVVEVLDVVRSEYPTRSGGRMAQVDLRAVVRFTHGASGTHIDVQALGCGADVGDKASNKALTGAFKYALRQTFCIETGDDPDNHASVERAAPDPRRDAMIAKVDRLATRLKASTGQSSPHMAPFRSFDDLARLSPDELANLGLALVTDCDALGLVTT